MDKNRSTGFRLYSTVVEDNRDLLLGGEVDHVIEGTVLSDGNDYGSVVRVGVDGCETVVACWDTGGDIDRDDAVDLGGVNTLEEGELRGVKDSRVVKVTHGLDDEVSVTDDDTLCVELLRSHVIRLVCIRENTSLHIVQGHLNRECLIGRNLGEVLGENELAIGLVGLWDNIAHRDRVARARGDLLSVGDRLSRAEVDKVVRARQGGDLTGFLNGLTILFETCFDEIRGESQRRVRVIVVVVVACDGGSRI